MIYTVTLNPALDYFMDYPEIEANAVNRTAKTHFAAGGKGIMESRMLSLLKTENTALGFLGGFTGNFVRDSLEQQNIKTDFTEISAETRVNVKVKTAMEETSLDAAGPELTDIDVQHFLEKFDGLEKGDSVVFAGTAPKSLGDDFYEKLIRKVKAQGAEFAVDIDERKLLDTLPMKPIIVKPNREELEEIFSVSFEKREDIIPYGKKLLALGAQQAMVSMAGDGALLFTADKTYFAAPAKGTVKNSVGAGDSTVAGFLAEWTRTKDSLAAFRQGVACGTAKAFSEDMPTSDFITECLEQIKITEI